MSRLILPGCRPEPLLSYLKALGVFRLVAEQADENARATWENDALVLHTTLSETQLLEFFIHKYKPTPVVVPWSGSFFVETAQGTLSPATDLRLKKTPSKEETLQAFVSTDSARLDLYRAVISFCLTAFGKVGIKKKSDLSKKKVALLEFLRSELPDEVIPWLDVAFLLDENANKPFFNTLLGSGGGNEGNAHFSDNFMQNLWEVLPDFDAQRATRNQLDGITISQSLLQHSLWDRATNQMVSGRTSSLYDVGASGGANTSQGMLRESLANPWNFILGLEGTLCLAGAVSKRLGASRGIASFPFSVRGRAVGNGTLAAKKESGHWEVWMPLWSRHISLNELTLLFAEGRSEVNRKPAQNGVDFARAIATYGTDRGLEAFVRYGIVKNRIGRDANSATALGRFVVAPQPAADLLNPIGGWLNVARRACDDKESPPRFRTAYQRLENCIMAYCRYGDKSRFSDVLAALGALECELGRTGKKPGEVKGNKVRPAPLLSLRWITATNDGTPEWRIAMALASIQGAGKVGPLRTHLEPIKLNLRDWESGSKSVVWTGGDLARNLSTTLERRLMEAERAGLDEMPLQSQRFALPQDVAAFLAEQLDEQRLEDLLWGAMLINWQSAKPLMPKASADAVRALPCLFALHKLFCLAGEHALTRANDAPIWPEAAVLAALRANDLPRANQRAVRRLRAFGYIPLAQADTAWGRTITPTRLAAALLIPLALPSQPKDQSGLPLLARLVLREPKNQEAAQP